MTVMTMATIDTQISEFDSDIYDEEMAFLNTIQSRFLNLHQQTPIEYQDPDVKRLTEAMAAFMAKGRIVGKKHIDQLHLRVFHQLLPYLSSPLASMGMLQANTQSLTEQTFVRKHTAFSIETEEGQQAQYRSLCDMPLQPIVLHKVGIRQAESLDESLENSIILNLTAKSRLPGQLNHLPVFLTYNDNYILSLQLKNKLSQGLISVSATFDQQTTVEGKFTFGRCRSKSELSRCHEKENIEEVSDVHPVEDLRQFFQLPQQENYLNLYFDESPAQWAQCQIELKLDSAWPKRIKLSPECFQLGVIGIENQLQEQAAPFTFDATQSVHPIHPPSTAGDLALSKCLGVYKGAIKKRDLIQPGILKGGNQAYQLYYQPDTSTLIDIQFVGAFTTPIKITIDAMWHQPDFSRHLWKKLSARTLHLDIPNLHFSVPSPPVPCLPLNQNDPHSLMELSLLKNKGTLTLEDILFLLENLGSVFKREYQPVKSLLKELTVTNESDYAFSLHDHKEQHLPLIKIFFSKLERLLTVWLANKAIRIEIKNPVVTDESPAHLSTDVENDLFPEEFKPIEEQSKPSDTLTDQDDRLIPVTPETFFFLEDQETSPLMGKKEMPDAE